MSQILESRVKTFSIGFNEDSFNELKYARIAAKHFNTEHHEFVVTPDLVEIVEDLVWHFDEPFADSSALPTFMVAKMARDFVTVVLSGDGGDELFAGYTRYIVQQNRSATEKIPRFIRRNILQTVGEKLPHGARGKNYLYNISLDKIGRYVDSVSYFGDLKKSEIYSGDFLQNLNGGFGKSASHFRQIAENAAGDDLEKLLYLDSKTYLPSDILTKVDRMTMANSLEARVPLLDHELVDFVTQEIPSGLKIKAGATKYIFKKALEGIVPNEILHREKQGFGVPVGEWINRQLKDKIRETLLEKRTTERGYFQPKYVKILLEEHHAGRRDHSHLLWILWMLELWHRRFLDN